MPKHPPNDPFGPALDHLWRKQIAIRSDFTERTMDRIRNSSDLSSDEQLEGWLDAALSASKVEPSRAFTEKTLRRIQEDQSEKVIRFPFTLVARVAAGMAAAIALLFMLGQPGPTSHPPEPTPYAEAVPQSHMVTVAEQHPADLELAALLMLAEGLDKDARWLLHGKENTALLAFVQ